MRKVTAAPVIDRAHPRKDGTCSIYIRVTFQRKKKEYPIGFSLSPIDFDRIINAKRRKGDEVKLYNRIISFHSKALSIIETLPIFTFNLFEKLYLTNTQAADTIKSGFESHINDLNQQNRIGTASSYQTALNSLEKFKNGMRYADITPELLQRYEHFMLNNGKSRTTVGIYLRSLRAIINLADIDRKIYPFGNGKNKYSIPASKNVKKALERAEIKKIFDYQVESGSKKAMAKDYWIFIYLCNGINVKDFCLLRYKDIHPEILYYERAKTIRSKSVNEPITVSLKTVAKEIIIRWGQKKINPETFVFPHLTDKMDANKQRRVYQQLTKTINKYMKQIACELQITKPVTTYSARHSFATILKNSGQSTEFISEALGHSNVKTTKMYLDSFEKEFIHINTDALTSFI